MKEKIEGKIASKVVKKIIKTRKIGEKYKRKIPIHKLLYEEVLRNAKK